MAYKPKFKIKDIVSYRGKIREGCDHDNDEWGIIQSRPNSAQPYYSIAVYAHDATILQKTEHGYTHDVQFLALESDLTLVE